MKTLYDLIAEQAFFRGLSTEHLRLLAADAMETRVATGEIIFQDGDLANRFYLVVAGKVALESSVDNRPAVLLQTLGPGDLLGWSWLFSPYVWRLHARAVEPTHAIFFYGTRLREQCEADHDLGYQLFKRVAEVMMQRLQSTRGKLFDHLAEHHPARGASAGERRTPGTL